MTLCQPLGVDNCAEAYLEITTSSESHHHHHIIYSLSLLSPQSPARACISSFPFPPSSNSHSNVIFQEYARYYLAALLFFPPFFLFFFSFPCFKRGSNRNSNLLYFNPLLS